MMGAVCARATTSKGGGEEWAHGGCRRSRGVALLAPRALLARLSADARTKSTIHGWTVLAESDVPRGDEPDRSCSSRALVRGSRGCSFVGPAHSTRGLMRLPGHAASDAAMLCMVAQAMKEYSRTE